MIRTQVYLDEDLHKDLIKLAKQTKVPMAKITRDILREGVKKAKSSDLSGKKALLALVHIGGKSDDPYLSENMNHYLYGAPKKQP